MALVKTSLDNPIWEALISHQSGLAEGDTLARRFPLEIGPLSGMIAQSEKTYAALAQLVHGDEPLVLFLDETPVLPDVGLQVELHGQLTQMVYEKSFLPEAELEIQTLTEADAPEMLALTRLTKPGPFEKKTHTLGYYIGIRESGRLAAMAGERLHLPGYTEISAVCTHPDFQGRGYAKGLMSILINRILHRGEIPFLHAWIDNMSAIRVYEKLGFQQRRVMDVLVLRKAGSLNPEITIR